MDVAHISMPANLEGEDLLYNLAYECEGLFDQLQETFQRTKSEVATIELCAEFQQRFAVWAAHLGVFARRSQCLDTRLQNHPDLQDLVARLLDILRRSLQQCMIDTSSQGEGDAVPTAALKTIDDTLTRLNRLGVTIRQSGRGKFDTRAKKFAAGLDLSSFASLCANAVQTLYPGAHQSLKDHLSKSMTDRYEKMLFLGFRHKKLETRRELRTRLSPIHEIPNKETQTSAAVIQLAMRTTNPVVANLSRQPPTLSQSDLSSVNMYQIRNRLRPPDEASTKFHKTSSIQVNQGNYPRPPATNQGSSIFTCQWCSELLSKKTLSESEWRKHIDRDLKPYICLSEACSEAYPAYPTFDEWFKHMELHDWRWHQQVYLMSSWVCTVCEFNQDVYGSAQALYSHLEDSHRSDFTDAQLQAISRQSKTEQPRASNDCLLCCFAVEEQGHNEEAVFPKRRKSQSKQEASKSARKTLEMTNPNPHSSDFEFSDTSSDSDDVGSRQHRKQRNKDRSKALTRHVAVHLQVLMLLTLRLADALQDDDGDLDDGTKSDSVDIDEGNSASIGTDLGRLSHIASEADVTMRDGQDGNDAENTDGAMELDEHVDSNIMDEDIPVPDTNLDLDFIPRQYDDLLAKDDKFLSKVIESGAYQSWQDEAPRHLDANAGREVVYCHACSGEWYRDERGLQCLRCGSDMTEIVSSENDPRPLDDDSEPEAHQLRLGLPLVPEFVVTPPGLDVVQEVADKYYRESMIARKIASDEGLLRKNSPNESVVDKWRRQSEDEAIVVTEPPDEEDSEENSEEYRSPYDPPNADVRIDNDIYPYQTERFRSTDTSDASRFKSRDPSCERDRPMLNLVRPTPIATPVSISTAKWKEDAKKAEMILRDMDDMVDTYLYESQRTPFMHVSDEYREALISFRQELQAFKQWRSTGATDVLCSNSLFNLSIELRYTISNHSTINRSTSDEDEVLSNNKEFCNNITAYKGRLAAIMNNPDKKTESFSQPETGAQFHDARVNEPGHTTDPEAIPLDILQVEDYYHKQCIRMLMRPLIKPPKMHFDPGSDNCQWVTFRADAASLNRPEHEVLAITQTSKDIKFTFRISGSSEDDLTWPPLQCALYGVPASDNIIFLNRSDVPISLSWVSHFASDPSLNERHILKPGLFKAFTPGTYKIEVRNVALLDFRILEKRPVAVCSEPTSSSGKLASREKTSEESAETEEDFSPHLKRVGHVEFDKIAKASTPASPPTQLRVSSKAAVDDDDDDADAKKSADDVGSTFIDGAMSRVERVRWQEVRDALPVQIVARSQTQREEDEEEVQRRRLAERMGPLRRRSTSGKDGRRHRVLYDDGLYRWE